MRPLILTAPLILLANCTQPAEPASGPSAFAREVAGLTAGSPQSCIAQWPSTNIRVIDRQTLAYDQGKTTWINRLAAPCPAIEPLNTVIVEPKLGTQYCNGDHIRGLEPGAIIPGPTCFLGQWVPYRRP